ncbi:MAG: hypothetical protein NVSMB56_05240 [Pyrinomonadaceae bacterium]
MSTTGEALALERRIKMHEAREAIINRLAPTLHSKIDLDKFLQAIVAEIGRMMNVDRCDVIQTASENQLRISHEWRASNDVPSSLGTTIPIDFRQLGRRFDLSKPIRLDDTDAPNFDPRLSLLPASLGTRSLLVVPIVLGGNVEESVENPRGETLGLLGLHTTQGARRWLDEEVAFMQSIARQIAVGYQYARLYTDVQREARRTHALLEIANALNARSDFSEVTSLVLERALALVGADYGALGVLNDAGKGISLAAFQSAPHAATEGVRGLIESYGKAVDFSQFPALTNLLAQGKTLRLFDATLPVPFRLIFNTTLGARAALVATVRVGGQPFGFLGLVWSELRAEFDEHETALVEAIPQHLGKKLLRRDRRR